VVDDIKKFPETYDTILKELKSNGTCQTLLRRKLNKLCKAGVICKTTIPGTRFGKCVFYVMPKKYRILVEGTRFGSKVYVFFKYKKISRYYIRLNEYWVLNGKEWTNFSKEKILFEGNILRFI